MRLLPLYADPPRTPVEHEAARSIDHACSLCDLHAKARTVCMGAEGEPGGLLIIGEGPTKYEDAAGRPFTGEAGKILRSVVRKWWSGPIAVDYATRCPGNAKEIDKAAAVEVCRGYLVKTIAEVKPTRIITLGSIATYAVLGRSLAPTSVRRGYGWITDIDAVGNTRDGVWTPSEAAAINPIPVLMVIRPLDALRNRFVRQWFDEDLQWAISTTALQQPPWNGIAKLIETPADAAEAVAAIRAAPWFSFDVETVGQQHDPDFEIISLACSTPDCDDAWVWDREALADAQLRQPLIDLMLDPSVAKGGQNVKYDTVSQRCAFGIETAGITFDTRLRRKLFDPEAPADLETMAELVGMGGHKREAQQAVKDALTELGRARRKGTTGSTDTLMPGMDRWVDAMVRLGADPIKYAYGMIPPDKLHRYNALDTISTTRLRSNLDALVATVPGLDRIWDMQIGPASRAIEQVETWGVAADVPAIRNFSIYLTNKIAEVKQRFAAYGADFNPNSTKQVQELLFGRLGLSSSKLTASGAASVDAEVLEKLAEQNPVAGDIVAYRTFVKLQGTYADGMLTHVRSDGRIHPDIKLDGARTGRASCSTPNLQNIPRAKDTVEGKMARDCFVAANGYSLLEGDYSQLELRVAALLSGDEEMIKVFVSGADYHQRTAEMISKAAWGISPEQVTEVHRTAAKIVNFGLLYGKTDSTLARDLGVTTVEAARIRAAIYGNFKKLARWIKEQLDEARRTGFIWTWWDGQPARRRPMWQIGDADDAKRKTAENGSCNTPIQGTASDFCLASLTAMVDWIKRDGIDAKLVLPIHDALLVEVRDSDLPEVAWHMQRIMTSWNSNGVPMVVDFKSGRSWGSLEKYKVAA